MFSIGGFTFVQETQCNLYFKTTLLLLVSWAMTDEPE